MPAVEQALQRELKRLDEAERELVAELTELCEIPAPTFHEQRRGHHVAERMRRIGLSAVEIDARGSVTGRLRKGHSGPCILVAAHLDTVFPDDTDVCVKRRSGRLHAPGVGDNAASIGCMLRVASALRAVPLEGEVIFASPVGEEGNGDLVGMRGLIERFKDEIDGVVAVDGKLGGVVTRAVGSRRFRLRVTGPGGHSWGDYGRPAATHILARILARVADMEAPREPRCTFNIGLIRGGTSVNTIAAEAEADIDLRSVDTTMLQQLERALRRIVSSLPLPPDAAVELGRIGDRPVGSTSETGWVALAARRALRQLGIEPVLISSSTDANIPMAEGIPAICLGVYRGSGAHTLEESLEIDSLAVGARALLLTLCGLLESAPGAQNRDAAD